MTCFRTSGALVLAACLFVTKVSTESVITCEDNNSVLRMSCDSGVISLRTALYGREDAQICSVGRPPQQLANTNCAQQDTVNILRKNCEGKRWCELNPASVRVSDPCPGTYKYLEANYTCFPALHVVLCEHSMTRLYCDVGQVIMVYGAYYGRRDHTTCSDRRPKPQLENVECSNPVSKVEESCKGKNQCLIHASNTVFGDPCVGTFKYLEVAYACQYPV
ncbi:L-rhamnose-binding lectin SML-like [Antennarius striatus]|uniref:L-rhamnose-binding lectin SML-like n=1 Tax=Antennarius striatus TaxID=241820 RepID=UPI0035B3B207